MGPEHLKIGGGIGSSIFHPLALIVVLIAGLIVCFGSRQKGIVAFLAVAMIIPLDQILVLGPLHFPMLRILALFGIVRLLYAKIALKHEIFSSGMNRLDLAVILLAVLTAVNGVLLWLEFGAVINQLGNLYTTFGIYFLLRFLIQNSEDVDLALRMFAYIALFFAIVMAYEYMSGRNPIYGFLGGARAELYQSVMERDGKLRASGSFGHPIIAGTFGAVVFPLFLALWWRGKKNRTLAIIGMAASTVITITSNSSTSLLAYAAAIAGLCLWPLRDRMKVIRVAIVATLIALHLVMKGPVWSLIGRIDLTGSSSGYHRAQLVDQCIRHFSDWVLFGVKDTSGWGWDMWDTANQYVGTADNSGLLPLVLFLAVIVYGFRFLYTARKAPRGEKNSELFLWALWSALFANMVGFFGISYWDQIIVAWYGLLAIIVASTRPVLTLAPVVAKKRAAPYNWRTGISPNKGTPFAPL